jgi:hypothetical protein
MATFLEMMKDYVETARMRLGAAEQAHKESAAELQAAASDFAIWNNAYTLAQKEREKWQAEARETQLPMDLPGVAEAKDTAKDDASEEPVSQPEINKTDKVREVLGLHVSGITPAQLWGAVKVFDVSRPYLYSVLKRLRDNDEVSVRKGGKYVLKPKPVIEVKPEEGVEGMTVQ